MTTFSIRTVFGLGGSVGLLGGSVSAFEITDINGQRKQNYVYKAFEPGLSFPVSPNLGSTSSQFPWKDIGVDQFSGWVTVGGGSFLRAQSFMDWASGPAKTLHVDTSGWSVSLPQVGVAHGAFTKFGTVEKLGPAPANWPIPKVTLGIWHSIPEVAASMRYPNGDTRHWAFYWGALVLKRFGGNYGWGVPDWQWDWYPNKSLKAHLPKSLMQQYTGTWQLSENNMGDDAVLKFRGAGEFAQLTRYSDVIASTPETFDDDENGLYEAHANDLTNGAMNGEGILWMVTEYDPG